MSRKARRKPMVRRTRPQRTRAVAFGIIVVFVLGTAGYLLFSAFQPKTPAPAAGTIDVSADMGGFGVKEVRVKAGKPVTLRLTSLDTAAHTDGGGKHQWAVDELGVNVIAPPQGSSAATFTPDKAGVYSFYCGICCGGRANPTMQGKLIVEEA